MSHFDDHSSGADKDSRTQSQSHTAAIRMPDTRANHTRDYICHVRYDNDNLIKAMHADSIDHSGAPQPRAPPLSDEHIPPCMMPRAYTRRRPKAEDNDGAIKDFDIMNRERQIGESMP